MSYRLPFRPIALTQCCMQRGAIAQILHLKAGVDIVPNFATAPTMLLVLCGQVSADATIYHAGDFIAASTILRLRADTEDSFCLVIMTRADDRLPNKIMRWVHGVLNIHR